MDYQFRNNTDYPIKINASVHDGYVDIEFIGTDTKDYYVEMDYVVLSKDPWETVEKVITDGSYENGETITTPYTGYTADTYKYKYSKATDELISKEFEAHSEYARRDKVVAVVRQATEPPVTDPRQPIPGDGSPRIRLRSLRPRLHLRQRGATNKRTERGVLQNETAKTVSDKRLRTVSNAARCLGEAHVKSPVCSAPLVLFCKFLIIVLIIGIDFSGGPLYNIPGFGNTSHERGICNVLCKKSHG